MSYDLLKLAFLAMLVIYVVSAIKVLFEKTISMGARSIVSVICLALGGLCYVISTVSHTTGGFAVGILAAVLSLCDSRKAYAGNEKYRISKTLLYAGMTIFFIAGLIMHPAFK